MKGSAQSLRDSGVLQRAWGEAVAESREFTSVYLNEIGIEPTELLARRSDDRGIAVLQVPRTAITQCQDVLGEHVSFNDVAVAALVLALRERIQPDEPGQRLIIDVPVSLALQTGGKQQFDTSSAMMVLEAPLDDTDPADLLRLVHTESKVRKSTDAETMAKMMRMATVLPVAEYRDVAARLWSRGNVFMSNLPGPDFPFYVAGNEVTMAFGLGQLRGHSALRVIVATYAGTATWSLMYDRQVLDGQQLPDAIARALKTLKAIDTAGPTAD